ncbi:MULTISPECIES: DUF7853 family protein [Halobaculum]|uniref:Uncharacterized protein n=2 Tax=Halobaculum TaxID=43927 RepID=A0A8T8W9V8_9EURY|nr:MULTISPECIES: hypothetical protein [Halobaculum]QZP36642.1 hypothetical protein K6T50_09985 [Halobaculum magnesiiphilum]QZY01619.1 hypothetical protein K6T36_09745 [Halobaculum roseum]
MAKPVEGGWRTLAFSREEAWVVHAALLDGVRTAVEAGDATEGFPELDALAAIEDGRERFDPAEVDVIRGALEAYLPGAPPRDLAPGRAALRRTDAPEIPDA